jgi:hypothetical protein
MNGEHQAPSLIPGEGSPAAARLALMQTDGTAPAPTAQPPVASSAPAQAAPAGSPNPPQAGLVAQADGSYLYVAPSGGRQLLPGDQVHGLAAKYLELESELPALRERAQATDEFLGMIGTDTRRHQQLNALIDHWRTGRPVPGDVFGIQAQQAPAPAPQRLRGWGDEAEAPFGQQAQPQPSQELEAVKAELAALRSSLAQTSQLNAQQQQERELAQRETSIRSQLGAYSFLKDNPHAMEAAARHALLMGRTDPRRSLDTIVREVATQFQGIVTASAEQLLRQARPQGQPTPISGSDGVPATSLQAAPLSQREFTNGQGVDRITKRLLDFANRRAQGAQ